MSNGKAEAPDKKPSGCFGCKYAGATYSYMGGPWPYGRMRIDCSLLKVVVLEKDECEHRIDSSVRSDALLASAVAEADDEGWRNVQAGRDR